jgi:hypothetical protein
MTYFDFTGVVEVLVSSNNTVVKSVRVRPLSYGVLPKVQGNTLTFQLDRAQNLSIEINGDILHNLQLFAGAIDQHPPDQSDPQVIYFGRGLHDPGRQIRLKDGQTLYLAGGAVVHSSVVCDHVHNVRIAGHGILYQANDAIGVSYSDHVEVDDITVMNPSHYAVLAGNATDLKIIGLKSFSSKGWGDGIDLFSSERVLIDNVFMRNSDDNIAIYGHRWRFFGDTRNVTVENAVLWADVAHPILVGTHGDPTKPEVLENLAFRNIDILEQDEPQIDYQGCLALNASDGNLIRHVVVDGMRVDDIDRGQLFNFRVTFNKKYAEAPGRGIEDVHLKDVSYTGTHASMSVVLGYDEAHKIVGITFENLVINGTLISDNMPGKPGYYKTGDMANIFVGDHVEGVSFLAE